MWILASFQSTSVPFIQILPVPGKDIRRCPSISIAVNFQRPTPNSQTESAALGNWELALDYRSGHPSDVEGRDWELIES